jgi:hypothetical protein
VLVIQQLWRGWVGATVGSTKIKRRGRDNEGGTNWQKLYWEVGATQIQGELRKKQRWSEPLGIPYREEESGITQ